MEIGFYWSADFFSLSHSTSLAIIRQCETMSCKRDIRRVAGENQDHFLSWPRWEGNLSWWTAFDEPRQLFVKFAWIIVARVRCYFSREIAHTYLPFKLIRRYSSAHKRRAAYSKYNTAAAEITKDASAELQRQRRMTLKCGKTCGLQFSFFFLVGENSERSAAFLSDGIKLQRRVVYY